MKSSAVKINEEIIPIDPLLIFQRISVVKAGKDDLRGFFKFELSPYPLSLFSRSGSMLKTQKSKLYDLFEITTKTVNPAKTRVLLTADTSYTNSCGGHVKRLMRSAEVIPNIL